jgi:hypothetical protein
LTEETVIFYQVCNEMGFGRNGICGDISEHNDCVCTWFLQKYEGLPISGPLLQEQVVKFCK